MLNFIAQEVLNKPLLCTPQYAETFIGALGDRIGIDASRMGAKDFTARHSAAPSKSHEGVAVVPIIGSLVHRGGGVKALSGARSYQAINDELNQYASDDSIKTILLEVDSPGGLVAGAFDLAEKISEISKSKRIIAFVNDDAFSAAYLLASGASQIFMTQTASVGSIGVVMAHTDRSKQLDMAGIKPTFIFAGDRKLDSNSALPLKPEAKDRFQASVDDAYDMFVAHVAKNRINMSEEAVRATEAGTFNAEKAIELGLADGIHTLESVLIEAAKPVEEATITPDTQQALAASAKETYAMPTPPKPNVEYTLPAPRLRPMTREQRTSLESINMARSMHGREPWSEEIFRQKHKIDEQNAATAEQLNASPYAKAAGQKLVNHLVKIQMGLDESIGVLKAAGQAQRDAFQMQAIADAKRFRQRKAV